MGRTSEWSRTGWRLLSAVAIATLVAACGGGGGDDDGDGGTIVTDDPAPPMPTTINFNIATKDAAPLAFSVDTVAISYPLLKFNGTWNRTADAWTMRGSTGVDSGAALFGAFSTQVLEPLQFTGDEPSAGKLEFATPAANSFFPGEQVQVTVGTNVLVTYNLVTKSYDWDTFLLLWPDVAQSNSDRLASFGVTASGLAADRGKLVLDLMATINGNDLKISAAGGYETPCASRPGAATGTRRIALTNPDGELNPGDGIVITYTNCWIDDQTDTVDRLLNGSITLSGYIENQSPFSTGFDEIRFNALAENETETIGGAVNVVQPAIVTNGTMTLFVTP